MKKQSAGLLLYRLQNGKSEVLIAHMGGPFHARKDAGHWSIPKGEYDVGENPKQVAQREFEEELDKKAPKSDWQELGSVIYKNGKQVTVWALEGDLDVSEIKSNTFNLEWPPRSGQMQEFPEVDRAEWFDLETAAKKLIPAQVDFLKRLADILHKPFNKPEVPKQSSLF
jgi:predicted NUDIX family NTP pyrophosphohydrolase